MIMPSAKSVLQKAVSMGFKQKDMAAMAGVSQSMISKISSVKASPSYETIRRLNNSLEQGNPSEKTAGDLMHRGVVFVKPDESLNKTKELMKKHGFSQIPVIENGIVRGVVTETDLLFRKGSSAGEVMSPAPQLIHREESTAQLKNMIKNSPCLLVLDNEVIGIITKHDLL